MIVALSAGITLAAAAAPATELERLLDESVVFMRGYVPFQVDVTTRLVAVSRDRHALVYHYRVQGVTRVALEAHAQVLSRRTCGNVDLVTLLELGGSVRYAYRLDSGDRIVHDVTLATCRAGTAL